MSFIRKFFEKIRYRIIERRIWNAKMDEPIIFFPISKDKK